MTTPKRTKLIVGPDKKSLRDQLRQQIKQDTFSRTPINTQTSPGELVPKTPEQEKQELWDNSFKNKPKGQAAAETSEGILIQNSPPKQQRHRRDFEVQNSTKLDNDPHTLLPQPIHSTLLNPNPIQNTLPSLPEEAQFNLSTEVKHTKENNLHKLSFEGYNGGAVNLKDYGLAHPMYYRIEGIKNKDSIPILHEHSTPIGHTTSIVKNSTSLSGEGPASYPSPKRDEVIEALQNGFPFQASMGLRVANSSDITFLEKGNKRVINSRDVVGPAYVAENSSLEEMTITLSGRDSSTTFQLLNKEALQMLLNSTPPTPPVVPPTPAPAPPVVPEPPVVPPTIPNNNPPVPPVIPNNNPPVVPPAPARDVLSQFRLSKLMTSYPDEKHQTMIENGLASGQDLTTIENTIKLDMFENGLPKIPKIAEKTGNTDEQRILTHFALACNVKAETLVKSGIDQKLIDNAEKAPRWSFVESLVNIANANESSKRFSGFSDVDVLCNSLQKINRSVFFQNQSYSIIDMPNLFKKVTSLQMEERWTAQEPFATKFLKEESNKDFRITTRIRPGGGEIWESMKPDGKIPHTHFGVETQYNSVLDTIAQLVIFNREHVYNDDMGVISSLLDAMVEGAMAVPDIKLGNKMLVQAAAANTFWVNADNSRTTFPLTRANLRIAYNDLRQYSENRGKNLTQIINDRWILITSVELEETAWDIIKQDRVVNNTTANTITGDKNYWFNKMDLMTFPQMANTSLYGTSTFVSAGTWLLWPASKKFSPYSITYLRGAKRPTIETIDLPENMLGFGVRGYWDLEVNERERLAIGRYNG